MTDYFQNSLTIRGAQEVLLRFADDALPRDGERGERSWGGHGSGPLSFLSLVRPPDSLLSPGTRSDATARWRDIYWGSSFPDVLLYDCRFFDIWYFFHTQHFGARNFVLNVSMIYPELAFVLVWSDVYSGDYGSPMEHGLLAVRAGTIAMDRVELSDEALKGLAGELRASGFSCRDGVTVR